jgi:hypothetical protein
MEPSMKHILTLSVVTVALFTTFAANATMPNLASVAASRPVPGWSLPDVRADRQGRDDGKAGDRLSDDRSQLALWTYCGFYTRPDGRTGIKCYTI